MKLTLSLTLLMAVALFGTPPSFAHADSIHERIQSLATLSEEQIVLAEALLLVSKEWNPSLDTSSYRARLDQLTEKARKQISGKSSPGEIVSALSALIHQQESYQYTDQVDQDNIPLNPDEIFLHGLLDTKRGYCMTLSFLYLIIGETLHLPLQGVALPNHFFVRYKTQSSHINIETTQSGSSLPDSYYQQRFGVPPTSGFFMKPLGKRQTLGAYFSNVGMTYYKQSIDSALPKASGKVDQAVFYLGLAAQINPSSIEAHNNLGNIFSELKQYPQAIEHYLLALKSEPGNLSTLFNLGLAYADSGDETKAIEALLQVVQIDPEFVPGHRSLTQLYLNGGNYISALLHLKKTLALEPENISARLNIAGIYIRMNLFDLALEALKSIQSADPENTSVLALLAETHYRMGNLDKAIVQYQQLIEYQPDNMEAYIQLGWTYYKNKQIPMAIAITTRGLSQAKPYPQYVALAYINLGLYHVLDEKFSKAESWYQKALASETPNALEGMVDDLKEASASFPKLAEIDYFSGWLFFEANDRENAGKFLNQYLLRAKEGALALKAKKLLNEMQGKKSDIISMTPSDPVSPLDNLGNMVRIPEGPFIMGSNDHGEDERPEHKVFLYSYFIDTYEVSAKEYAEFLNAVGNEKKYYQANKYGTIEYNGVFKPVAGFESYPVNNVSWFGAAAYCQWKHKRLPSEAEWEKAARGSNGQVYPWGNSLPTPDSARFGQSWTEESKHQVMVPVNALPQGKSFYGAYNMAGNVKEWVDDWFDREYYSDIEHKSNPLSPIGGEYKVLRGGSWRDLRGHIYSSFRNNGYPENRLDDYGFRCAQSIGDIL